MKIKIMLLMVLGLFISCSKEDPENLELVGKWELIEVLNDPGDGSGEFQAINSDKTIEFFDNGTVISNGSLCYNSEVADMESSGTFSSEELIIESDNCNVIENFPISFTWTNDILIISYPCFEPCSAKYRKVP